MTPVVLPDPGPALELAPADSTAIRLDLGRIAIKLARRALEVGLEDLAEDLLETARELAEEVSP